MTTCAVYLRISKDKALGTDSEGLAVDRQRKDIHKLLKAKGWAPGEEYLENDTSASGKVPRPEYERMLGDYQAGEFEAIAAWDLDRLWRVPSEFEHLLTLADKEGLKLATVGGEADLSTDNGILYARIKVAVAASELSRRSARQKAKFAQDREAGRNHWRGRRPFGLELDGTLREDEAQALRDIAEKIVDGGTVSAGVALLTQRGIKTTFGGEWQRQPLRKTILNPRVAGLLEHDGELLPGQWDAVLDRDTWEAACRVLTTPGRSKPKLTGQEYFLSGLLRCSVCGGKCYGTRAHSATGNRKETYIYRCAVSGHVSKSMTRTDNLVLSLTLRELNSVDYKDVEADKEALKALREDRAKATKDWADWLQEAADEGLRPSDIRPARERYEVRMQELNTRIAEFEKISLVRLPTPEEAEDGIIHVFNWFELSVERRRRLVETVWKSITLVRTRKGARWSSENIVFEGF